MVKRNRSVTRREALPVAALSIMPAFVLGCTGGGSDAARDGEPAGDGGRDDRGSNAQEAESMRIYYLEVVTRDVDGVCGLYSKLHGASFGEPEPNLGGARTIRLAGGELVGVRAPMHEGERPVVRPYALVEDIEEAVALAAKSGAEVAVPPMEIPGHGKCAIYFQGGIEFGLWEA